MVLRLFPVAAVLVLGAGLWFFELGRRDYWRYGRLRLRTALLQAALFFGWGCMGWIFLPRDWPDVHVATAWAVAGRILLWGGIVVTLLAIVWLGWMRSMGQRRDLLRRSGPYRMSRNPQCVACAAFGLGFAVLWPSVWAVAWVALLLALLVMMVRIEEKHLRRTFGTAYEKYCAQVPRWFGLPRRTVS